MATENLKSIEINGFGTIQRFTSRHLARQGDLYQAPNVDIVDNAGRLKLGNKGYQIKGATLDGAIRGAFGHMLNDGTEIPIVVKGDSPYVWNGTSWDNTDTSTFDDDEESIDFTSFLNRVLMTDGVETLSSADGKTWDSTLLTDAPTGCLYIEHFATRLVMANKSVIYWSTLPNDDLDDVTWNITEQNVIPQTDDGDFITGIKRLRKRLLVFKNYSIHRLFINDDLEPDLLTIDETIGCPITQKKGVTVYKNIAYFFGVSRDGEQGIFATNGESVELISRPVQDIIRAIPQSFYPSIRVGLKNGIIKFYIGDVTIDDTIINNCELQYSPRDQAWQYRSLDHIITDYAVMKVDGENGLYLIESTGKVLEDEKSQTFDGNTIFSFIETPFIDIDTIDNESTLREIWITGKNINLATVQYATSKNPTHYNNVDDKLNRGDLFKGIILKDASSIKIRISSNEKNIEIHKIKINILSNQNNKIYE